MAKIKKVLCERCGKEVNVKRMIYFNLKIPPCAYCGFNICPSCYKEFNNFLNELGRLTLYVKW